MRIMVVSDTHNNQAALFNAFETAGTVDAIIHLGDGETDAQILSLAEEIPLFQVAGNCDIGSTAPRELFFELEGLHLMLCHGDIYGVKKGLSRLIQRAVEYGADAVLYGHTHLAQAEKHEGLWLINPGTLSSQAEFHSFAIIEIDSGCLNATIYQLF
jgi:putative phosphoesterase